jgi:2-methylcitrate dehydratase
MDVYLRPDEVNHPCDNIMAIPAAAEHMGGSREDFVTAVVIACEIQKRLLDAGPHQLYDAIGFLGSYG